MAKAFPKQLYVVWDQPPNDTNSYLLAAQVRSDHATLRDKKRVGVYRLVAEEEIEGIVKVKPLKRHKA